MNKYELQQIQKIMDDYMEKSSAGPDIRNSVSEFMKELSESKDDLNTTLLRMKRQLKWELNRSPIQIIYRNIKLVIGLLLTVGLAYVGIIFKMSDILLIFIFFVGALLFNFIDMLITKKYFK